MSENYAFQENREGADIPHAFRYYVARGFVEPEDTILDVACGWGAGANILARSLSHGVVGIDYRKDCIDQATEIYGNNDIKFNRMDLNETEELPPSTYSVTIETIEHLKEPKKFASMQKKYTKERIFVTTPIIKTMHGNEHHLHDFTAEDVIRLYQDDEWRIFHRAEHGGMYGMFLFVKRDTLAVKAAKGATWAVRHYGKAIEKLHES